MRPPRIADPARLNALLDAVLAVQGAEDLSSALSLAAEALVELTASFCAALYRPGERPGAMEKCAGAGDAKALDSLGGSIGAQLANRILSAPKPIRLSRPLGQRWDRSGIPWGPFLGIPLASKQGPLGCVCLFRTSSEAEFGAEDESMAVAVAKVVSTALRQSALQERVAELSLAADRERIARELHDTVVQRLFATGLSLQAVLPTARDPFLHDRIDGALGELDETIRQVRTTIFALEPPPATDRGVRIRVLEVCGGAARSLGFEPEVRFSGPVDTLVDGPIATELLSTLREALSNVARHAGAKHVQVEVVASEHLVLKVTDDGAGIAHSAMQGRGMLNMSARAESMGGSFEATAPEGGGTELSWVVPLSRPTTSG